MSAKYYRIVMFSETVFQIPNLTWALHLEQCLNMPAVDSFVKKISLNRVKPPSVDAHDQALPQS